MLEIDAMGNGRVLSCVLVILLIALNEARKCIHFSITDVNICNSLVRFPGVFTFCDESPYLLSCPKHMHMYLEF